MTEDHVRAHARSLFFSPAQEQELVELVKSSGLRQVGSNALHNVVVHLASRKNKGVRSVESHTVERICALELELDPDVKAYFCQPSCTGVRRNGGRHVTSGTLDFLVFRATEVVLLECKDRSSAAKLAQKKADEWLFDGRNYRWLPYEQWAAERGLSFKVWIQPERWNIYLANLELMVALVEEGSPMGAVEDRAIRLISQSPRSIDELMCDIPRFNSGVAARLIASKELFGPIHEVLLTDATEFTLYSSSEQAEYAESTLSRRTDETLAQPGSPLLRASATDLAKARTRLKEIDRLRLEGGTFPRGLKQIARRIESARREGRNPLEVCLTNYFRSGNRHPRLSVGQRDAMDEVRRRLWTTGEVHTLRELHLQLQEACTQRDEATPSYKTLAKFCKGYSARRALATGGKRAYQVNRPASDPRQRSQRAVGRHLKVIIDSTKLDNRLVAVLGQSSILDCPLVYIACDSCTNEAMAHAFVFGTARRDGVALLIRDYVRRHRCLPHQIQVDRGTENTSKWLRGFCENYQIALIVTPTASSRTNGQVENLHGRLNQQFSHRLEGSTAPDKAGRSVDGRFKSYRTAKLLFAEVSTVLETAIYDIFAATPDKDGFTPSDYRDNAEELTPQTGITTELDEELIFQTSIPVYTKKFDPRKGIRTNGTAFTSKELLASQARITDVRRDPGDSTLLHVRTERGTWKAWAASAVAMASKPEVLRVFHALAAAQMRKDAEAAKHARARERAELTARANKRTPNNCSVNDENISCGKDIGEPIEQPVKQDSASASRQVEEALDFDALPTLEELPQ